MTLTDLDDAALAARLAYEAGQLALDVRAGSGLTGKALGDAGESERVTVENLSSRRVVQGVVGPGGDVWVSR